MAEPIGALRAELSANSAQFEKDMGRARNAVRSSSTEMQRGFGGVTASVKSLIGRMGALIPLLTGAGLVAFGKQALKAAADIGVTADKIGISVEALQELRFAADQAQVEQRTLDMALQRFSRRVGEAAQGTGELLGVVKQYNIAVRDGEGRQRALEEILGDYAEVVRNAESDQERLRLAFKAFDSEGAVLVNVLRQGRDGLSAVRAEARRVGAVLSDDLVRNAEAGQREFDKLGFVIRTQATAAFLELAPRIKTVTTNLIEGITAINRWIDAIPQLNSGLAEYEQQIKAIQRLPDVAAGAAAGVLGEAPPPGPPPFRFGTKERRGEEDRVQKMALQELAALEERRIFLAEEYGIALQELGTIQERFAAQGRQVFMATRTEAEKFGMELDRLNLLFEVGEIDAETYSRAVGQISDQFVAATGEANEMKKQLDQINTVTALFATQVSRGFASAIVRAENLGDAFKELGLQLAEAVLQALILSTILGAFGVPSSQMGGIAGFFGGLLGFQKGGMVPGPIGMPRLAVVHGGEMVVPPDEGGSFGNTFLIDARGAERGVSAEIMRAIRAGMEQAEIRAVHRVRDNVDRGGDYRRSFR